MNSNSNVLHNYPPQNPNPQPHGSLPNENTAATPPHNKPSIRKAVPAFYDDSSFDPHQPNNEELLQPEQLAHVSHNGRDSSASSSNATYPSPHSNSNNNNSNNITSSTPSIPSTSSNRGAPSSEEDSVAEMMDYQSEGSSNFSSSETRQQKRRKVTTTPTTTTPLAATAPASAARPTATLQQPQQHQHQHQPSSLSVSFRENASVGDATAHKNRMRTQQDARSVTYGATSAFESPQNRAMLQHHLGGRGGGSGSNTVSSPAAVPEDPGGDYAAACVDELDDMQHRPCSLPKFPDPQNCMWTASHAANCPSEDRSASLVNVLLQPLPPNFDSETQLPPLPEVANYPNLIRLNLWSVIDGHGGGCVATYASEVLLPHIAASVSRALGCAIVDRGVCIINGQLRDANAVDLDGLIQVGSDSGGFSRNPNSIHYRSPYERSDSEEEEDVAPEHATTAENIKENSQVSKKQKIPDPSPADDATTTSPEIISRSSESKNTKTMANLRDHLASTTGTTSSPPLSARSLMTASVPNSGARHGEDGTVVGARSSRADEEESIELGPPDNASVSSVKTSVKTAASLAKKPLVGTHCPREVAAITRAITESFLAVDEGWINSIDPVATHQTSCQSNGRWNSGACALVVFTIQRLEWTSVSEPDREKEERGPEKSRRNTSQNRDAARRRMLDYAARTKSASSMSTVSSTSSLTTEEMNHASGLESEITETEGEDEYGMDNKNYYEGGARRRNPNEPRATVVHKESLISPPGGCSCHCYRAHDAMLYTAHVGDCRAVMLGSAPPRTIKVRGTNKPGHGAGDNDICTDDDESSHHSSDETECLSSSDHDADSSEEEDYTAEDLTSPQGHLPVDGKNVGSTSSLATASTAVGTTASSSTATSASYRMIPRRVARQRGGSPRKVNDDNSGPFRPLPPLNPTNAVQSLTNMDSNTAESIELRAEDNVHRFRRGLVVTRGGGDDNSSSSSNDDSSSDGNSLPLIHLPPVTRPIDLTTDHSAYNPAEVTAVLRRCNNAPRAISAGVGGGIKRVAGSLAVTRALGDAYLKTPLLSFNPYKSHAPYISARPEVNCRPLVKDLDKVLVLATDGVWERAGGEDVLRWVRNFYMERAAEEERRRNRRENKNNSSCQNADGNSKPPPANKNDEGDGNSSGNGDDNDNDNEPAPKNNNTTSTTTSNSNSLEGADRDLFETTTTALTQGGNTSADAATSSSRKRDHAGSPTGPNKRRKRNTRMSYNVADVIVRRVLNKVRRARNISSLQALMSLPLGRARRSKHDDITSSIVNLGAFVS